MAADLAIKEPARVATTGNITLSGLQTIDGIALSSGDRVLVRAQTTTTQNGIYVAASGAWTRDTDFDASGEVVGGTAVFVTAGVRFGDSTWRVTGDYARTPGISSITFDPDFLQSGTGAVPRGGARKLAETPITPEDFGAEGNGHLPPGTATDDTAAVQAAMDEAAASGRPLYLKNMYAVTDTITWQKQGDAQGPIIYGDGRLKSGLAPYGLSGPVLRIDGSSLQPYTYARGGWLHDFRIFPGFVNGDNRGDGFFSSGSDTTGIELIGFFLGDIERVEIQGLTGSGIVAPRREDLEDPENGLNSDGYQTQARVSMCDLLYNGGWAIDGDAGLGCILSVFDSNILANAKGGVRLAGGAWRVIRNAIAFNGSPDHDGGGILVDVVNGTPHTAEIYNNEIDTNYEYSIDLKGMTSPRIIQNRFNASTAGTEIGWPVENIVRPPVGVRAGFGAASVVGLQAEQNEFRNKVAIDEPDSAVTAWQLDGAGGLIFDADILKSRYSASSANLTRYARGGGALLAPTILAGVITGVTVVNGGEGYDNTVPINAYAGGGTGFQATVLTSSGVVTGATITNGGSGYDPDDTQLAVRPQERQGLSYSNSLRVRDGGYQRYAGGLASFKSRLSSGNIEPASATLSTKLIKFATEESDFDNYYNTTTGKFTFPGAGNYLISVTLCADLGGAGSVNLWAYVDGSQRLAATHGVAAAGDNSFTLTGIVWAGGGEELTIHADNSTGSAKASTGGLTCNHFSVALVG